MAITVTPEILGQQATAVTTYCYLYEPLRVLIEESNLAGTKLFIDIELRSTANDTVVEQTLTQYGEYDINSGVGISVDLMRLARQLHDADLWKFAQGDDVYFGEKGLDAGVSRLKYRFLIYTDVTATQTVVEKLPIIGGRSFDQFTAAVDENSPVNEFQYYGLNESDYKSKWDGALSADLQLEVPSLQNARPSIVAGLGGTECIEGALFWKSRFGGWMWWGFDIQQRKFSKKYGGNLDVGMFESTEESGGKPYVAVDYTNIETMQTRTLKALSLSREELLVVAGIEASQAVYYLEPAVDGVNPNRRLELMRVSSVSTPIDSKSGGGDFSVSLKSISKQTQNTI